MMKARLAEIGTSGLNVRYFYIPDKKQKKAHYAFNIRLNISDPYILLEKDDHSIAKE